MSTSVQAKAMLFDMDGTLLGMVAALLLLKPDSTPAVNATWDYFAREYSLDLTQVLKTSHGVRTIDNLRRWCGLTDPAELQSATELFETMIVQEAKRLQDEGKRGLQILPGVEVLLGKLQGSESPKWAIITSATNKYASAALPTARIPPPPHLVTADDVVHGKPNPEPYLTGADLLKTDIRHCIVIEDAPSGIKSGVASGARVLAVCTSHPREQLEGLGATWIVEDLSGVACAISENDIHLEIPSS